MTCRERAAALALRPGNVTYLPASYDKAFARNLAAEADTPEPTITARQRDYLRKLLHKYRRQLPATVRNLLDSGDQLGTGSEGPEQLRLPV